MKKAFILAGIASAFCTAAHAQSSVTLYGSLDAGIAYVNNVGGHAVWLQNSGNLSNTYYGLRGAEDLGGGLKAVFTLEEGFNLNNGSLAETSTMFSRQAFVGLKSDQYGTVTLGRQYDSVVDYLSPLALAGTGSGVNLAAHPFDADNIGGSFSTKNAVKFESRNDAGFHFGGMYGFSNEAGAFADGRAWSLGAGYANGPFTLAASYLQLNNSFGTNPVTGSATYNAGGAASADVNLAALHRVFGVGANYAFGRGTVGVLWTHTQLENVADAGVNMRFDNFEVNGTFAATPALAFVGAYTFTSGKTSGDSLVSSSPKWQSVTLGADYSFSARTDAYVAGVYQHTSGAFLADAAGNEVSVTSIAGMIPSSSTPNQIAVAVGMRHRF